jgi:hypothetical protein
VDKKPVQGVPYKQEPYYSGSNESESLPSYVDKTSSSTDRHTSHNLPVVMEKEQEQKQQQQYDRIPQRIIISQHPSLSIITGNQRSLSRRTTSLHRSHMNLTDISSIAPTSNYNYRSSMQSHHHSSLLHLQTDSGLLRSSYMFNSDESAVLSHITTTNDNNHNNTSSVLILPTVTRQSSSNTWSPQRSPPRPPSPPIPSRTVPQDE